MSLYLIESGCFDVLQIERCTEKSNFAEVVARQKN